jgi:hypothetical protein
MEQGGLSATAPLPICPCSPHPQSHNVRAAVRSAQHGAEMLAARQKLEAAVATGKRHNSPRRSRSGVSAVLQKVVRPKHVDAAVGCNKAGATPGAG